MNDIPLIKTLNSDVLTKSFIWSEKLVNPKREWEILVIVFAIFILSAIAFDFYMYRQIVGGDMYVSVKKEEVTVEKLKSTELQKILSNFEIKKSKIMTQKLENLVDPSI